MSWCWHNKSFIVQVYFGHYVLLPFIGVFIPIVLYFIKHVCKHIYTLKRAIFYAFGWCSSFIVQYWICIHKWIQHCLFYKWGNKSYKSESYRSVLFFYSQLAMNNTGELNEIIYIHLICLARKKIFGQVFMKLQNKDPTAQIPWFCQNCCIMVLRDLTCYTMYNKFLPLDLKKSIYIQ